MEEKKTLEDIFVFVAPTKSEAVEELYPKDRQIYANVCNEQLKKHRYSTWKLLEFALKKIYGYNIKEMSFFQESGKWLCKECYFSLSHSEKLVAVAISKVSCGVDLENKLVSTDLANKILTEKELQNFNKIEQKVPYMSKIWVKKESIFKLLNPKTFIPSTIEVENYSTWEELIKYNNENYYLAVASFKKANVKLFIENDY